MRRFRILLCLPVLLIAFGARAQVQGTVVEAGTDTPVPYANLLMLTTGQGTSADETGNFTLNLISGETRVRISALGFRSDTVFLQPGAKVVLRLERDNELPLVTVRSEKEQLLTELRYDKFMPVYLTDWQDRVVTCYRRSARTTYQLRILFPDGREIVQDLDIGKIEGLSSQCTDRLYVLTAEDAISFELKSDRLKPVERLPRNDFEWLFADCQDRSGDDLLYEKKRLRGMNKFYLLSENNQRERLVREYRDSVLLEEYFHGVPIMDFDWVETKRPQMWASANSNSHRAAAMRHFDREVLYKNYNDNPFFFAGNTIKLLNFDEGLLETYTRDGDPLAAVPFNAEVDRKTEVQQRVFLDPLTGDAFVLARDKKGHRLYALDLDTGRSRYLLHFDAEMVRHLAVRGNRFYLLGQRDRFGPESEWRIYRGEI